MAFALVLVSAFGALASAFGGGLVVGLRPGHARFASRRNTPAPALPQRYSVNPADDTFTRVEFDPIARCTSQSRALAEQPEEWRAGMAAVGDRLRESGVAGVVFVHGTFVGDDPFAFVHSIKRRLPRLSDALARAARVFAKAQSDRLLGDNANFVTSYIRLFEEAIGPDIPCTSFVWSSENHHVARVHGAARLARALSAYAVAPRKRGAASSRPRVLLVGHSHAGQLFAILTQLLAGGSGTAALLEAARARGEDIESLERDLEAVRRVQLDFVTFGTPPRYGFGDAPGYRLMNVVNHRGARRVAGLRGFFRTESGDYIQQLGISGSDFPAALETERRLNTRLDAVLGTGTNLRALLRNVRHGLRVPQHGHTFLVDYRDASERAPNFVATVFGHGVYTRFPAMLFNSRLIVDHFYPERPRPFALALAASGFPALPPMRARYNVGAWAARLRHRVAERARGFRGFSIRSGRPSEAP